uniref:Uncharacterized protein n=1 Tax=Panagrolaimus sp. PS1159 TaxID=55785 RepID=A0AC35GDL2_9BILA
MPCKPNNILFQYAPKREDCGVCEEIIPSGDLEVVYEDHFHFTCFFGFFDVLSDKRHFLIAAEEYNDEKLMPKTSVSLEDIDFPGGFDLKISDTDLTKIREHLALVDEHKTRYFIPSVSINNDINCPEKCVFRDPSHSAVGENHFSLFFQNNDFHPECLARTGKVNIDAKEITGYDSLADDKKRVLDEIFKKDNGASFLPLAVTKATSFGVEFCPPSECLNYMKNNSCKINGLGVRYKTKSYHPKCLAELGKVNVDAMEIVNYDSLSNGHKNQLGKLFMKTDNFDTPIIELAKDNGYCSCCILVTNQPSKFPYPYTLIKDDAIIKFHDDAIIKFRGESFHPECFKSSGKVNMDVKDFRDYDKLDDVEKQELDQIFMQHDDDAFGPGDGIGGDTVINNDVTESLDVNNGIYLNSAVTSVENDINDSDLGGPPAAKIPKLESHMNDDADIKEISEIKKEVVQPELITLDEEVAEEPPVVNNANDAEVKIVNLNGEDCAANGNALCLNDIVKHQEITFVVTNDQIIQQQNAQFNHEEPSNNSNIVGIKNAVPVENNEMQSKVKQEADLDLIVIYQFELPTVAFLTKTLKLFDIPYTLESLIFWSKIEFKEIPANASPESTFHISSSDNSFFKCLSCFITGNETYYYQIKSEIQTYFRSKFKTFGTIDGFDFSNLKKSSPQFQKIDECNELSNVHFTFICTWFDCRIGIYTNDRLSGKFGNWDCLNRNSPVFLIENNNGFYKPVLSLTEV